MTFYLGMLFLVVAGGIIVHIRNLERKVKQSLSWPSVAGEITCSKVVRRGSGGNSGQGSTFRADVQYSYEVGAKPFRGDKVCVGVDVGTGSRTRAEERCRRYGNGSVVSVYYNPDNPGEACLEPVVDAPYFFYSIAAAFGFFGLGMVTNLIQF
ncbi:MAG: DUF3592 domain-containing protein [Gammaproteobacteria bacterium]|nr:DUF3592 domain-containing protein [Gammaproteobacteria bacterium]